MSGLDRRPARRRRRRRLAIPLTFGAVLLVVAAVAVVLIAGATGGAHRGPGIAATPRTPAARDRRRHGITAAGTLLPARGVAEIRRLIALGRPLYCGGNRGNAVALTFDDGPGVYTHYAVHKLRAAHEQATFFVVGRSIDAWPGWLQREKAVAAFGDHTLTHPELTTLPAPEVTHEIGGDKTLIERQTGEPVYLFRPPYALRDALVDRIVKRLGLLDVLWSDDSRDSLGANYAQIIDNVEAGLHPGAIFELHENRGQTIRALTTLLPVLHRRHLRSVSIPELLAIDPPSRAQVLRGELGCGRTPLDVGGE